MKQRFKEKKKKRIASQATSDLKGLCVYCTTEQNRTERYRLQRLRLRKETAKSRRNHWRRQTEKRQRRRTGSRRIRKRLLRRLLLLPLLDSLRLLLSQRLTTVRVRGEEASSLVVLRKATGTATADQLCEKTKLTLKHIPTMAVELRCNCSRLHTTTH